ncbi:MAG: hypothetical protein ABIF85_00270 [Nanoarchaeota archaeon]|nr:hypothetical protein [Nanoarchaeota archaeon]MBU4300196.1 hypothetical protein [Nanoarchaeota archaeon]MBU4452070.1 hypothetical protein [Nanoarchaeota archaeon]MCG2724451.1 hypothetical protein [archaeon]
MPEKKSGGFKKAIEERIAEYLKESAYSFLSMLKRRIKQYALSMMLAVASLVVIIYGIGTLMGYLIPTLVPGTSHIIVGLLFLLAARAYSKK